ncbi:MAG: ribonuclease P protein component 1 [Candidatus Thermoplasmatota archaeon]|nr:ribonuclease P protein component 1 [Candidatus Thermoplasmatota archaeon]
MRTAKNLVCHELIGLNVRIKESKDKKLNGLEGRIVDETMKMFVFESGGKEIEIPKDRCVWEFTLPDGTKAEVDGSILVHRPEDRTKKLGK